MAKLQMKIELDYDDDIMHGDDKEAIDWFFNDILKGGHLMIGEFFELGDMIGDVKVIEINATDHISRG